LEVPLEEILERIEDQAARPPAPTPTERDELTELRERVASLEDALAEARLNVENGSGPESPPR
jgi:shikimate kinase